MLISRGAPVALRKHVDRRVFITLELLHVPGFQVGVPEGIFPDVEPTFGTEEGATRFAVRREPRLLSTARKQGQSMFAVLRSIIEKKPWKPLT